MCVECRISRGKIYSSGSTYILTPESIMLFAQMHNIRIKIIDMKLSKINHNFVIARTKWPTIDGRRLAFRVEPVKAINDLYSTIN